MKQSAVRSTRVRSTVPSRHLLSTSALSRALLVALAGVSFPALADKECGAPDASGQVVCTADQSPLPQVHYQGVADFELLLESGVTVDGSLLKEPGTAVVVYGEGAVSLTADDNTVIRSFDGWPAVDVVSSSGPVTVRVDQVFGGNVGVAALAAGDVSVWANHVEGVVAVEAVSEGGNVTVDVASVRGGAYGAGVAATAEHGNVDVMAGEAITLGDFSTGLFASSHDGSTSIHAGYVAAEGVGAVGVFAESWENGDVFVDVGTAVGFGEGSAGILAGAGLGDVAVRTDWVSGAALGLGVFAFNGSVALDVGGASTDGDFARAIDVYALGSVDLLLRQSAVTFGQGSDAVSLETVGEVAVQADRLTTYGNESYGLRVLTSEAATLDIDEIATYGELSSALQVNASDILARVGRVHTYATTGDWYAIGLSADNEVNLLVEEEAIAESGYAITASSWLGGVTIGVAEGATVSGAAVAIDAASAEGTRIDIAGTVAGGTGHAIQAWGNDNGLGAADIRIASTGSLLGSVQLSEGGDVLSNAGEFLTAGTSAFGAGDDRIANAGLVALQDGATAMAFDGLERFDNGGRISLANGATGDVFSLDGTLHGAAGNTLAVDLDVVGHALDVVEVGALSGTNALELNLVGSGSLLGMDGLRVLTSDAAQTGDELVLAANSRNRGFVGFRLAYDGIDSWRLDTDLTDSAYLAGAVPAGARDLWRQGAQSVATHLTATHDQADAHGAWVQAVGGDFEGTSTFAHAQGSRELEWQGDHHGLQLGAETTFGTWRAGVTGGFGKASMDLGGAEETRLDSVNAGLYAQWASDGWFGNALLRAERLDVETDWASIGLQEQGDGSTVGLALEGGRRFTPGRAWIEPYLRLSWIDVSLPEQDGSAGDLHWEDAATGSGELGLRLGVADGWHGIRPYAAMSIARDFGGGDVTVYDTGFEQVRVSDEGERAFGRFAGGATWTIGRVDLYGEVEARVGDMEGTGGRLGARVRF